MSSTKQYLSGCMEEYFQENENLHKDVMIEKLPPLTSPEGSSNRNPPERCPRPLDYQDSTKEDQEIPQKDKCTNAIKVKVEDDPNVMSEESCKKEDTPSEISMDAFNNRNIPDKCPSPLDSTQEGQVQKQYAVVKVEDESYLKSEEFCKKEEIPSDISTGPHPLYSQYSTQEDQEIPQDDQNENLIYIKVKVKEEAEEIYETEGEPHEQEMSPEIGTDGQPCQNIPERPDVLSSYQNIEDSSIPSEELPITSHFYPTHQSADPSYILSTPEISFSDRSPLVTYFPDRSGSDSFSCFMHGEYLTQSEDVSSHQRSCIREKPYSCTECGKFFGRKENLILHQRSHTGVKPFPCTECGRCFTRKDILILHQRTHTGVKPFSCPECGKSFSRKETLTSHQRSHTGEKPYSCSECKKCFSQRETLVLHQRIHTGMKPYSCLDCGKSFTQRAHLLSHERNHTGEKPYSCSSCGKSFIQRVHLISHERTHSGVKPFSCSECGKCFAERSNLVKHQRTHTGEKPYSCSECGKCFSERSSLITHEKVHTGEKPYSCSECGKRFSKKSYLLSHLGSHKEQQLSVTECGN